MTILKNKVINRNNIKDVDIGSFSLDATTTSSELKEMIAANEVPMGSFCSELDEIVPKHERADCERVWNNENNSFIVLGRDRPASLGSGYGGMGAPGCGMIDLVTGRLSSTRSLIGFKMKESIQTGPNFAADAARIYISQMANIDEYFGLPDAKPFQIISSEARSAVAAKADHIRIVGRNDVKIYAGRMKGWAGFSNSFGRGEPNSQAGPIDNTQCHIYLMGGGSEDVQPVVRGENLKKYLIAKNKETQNIVDEVSKILLQLTQIFAALTPVIPAASENVRKNIIGQVDQVFSTINQKLDTFQYLGMDLGSASLKDKDSNILSSNVFTS